MRRSSLWLVAAVAWSPLVCAQSPPPMPHAVEQTLQAKAPSDRANLRGFSVGVDPLVLGALTSDYVTSGRAVNGLGLALRFGWGFSDHWTLLMDVAVTDLAVADSASYFLSHGDILMRWTPRTIEAARGTWAPFVQAGLGFRDVSPFEASPTPERIYFLEGEVLTVGAGAAYFVSPKLSLSAVFNWSAGNFNDERIGMVSTHGRGLPGKSWRAGVGINWHKGRRSP